MYLKRAFCLSFLLAVLGIVAFFFVSLLESVKKYLLFYRFFFTLLSFGIFSQISCHDCFSQIPFSFVLCIWLYCGDHLERIYNILIKTNFTRFYLLFILIFFPYVVIGFCTCKSLPWTFPLRIRILSSWPPKLANLVSLHHKFKTLYEEKLLFHSKINVILFLKFLI